MKSLTFAAIALAAGSATSVAQPRDTVRVDIGHGSQVWIEGSSNVVDWRCRATAFDAQVELDVLSLGRDEGIASALRVINVKVAVRDLKCGNRKMEHDLYAALGASDPTQPAFILGRFSVIGDSVGGLLDTRGPLSVAGVVRNVTMAVATTAGPEGTLRARGGVSLLMTDFGVKPPVGLFGLIRSKNEVTVKFDLIVARRAVALR